MISYVRIASPSRHNAHSAPAARRRTVAAMTVISISAATIAAPEAAPATLRASLTTGLNFQHSAHSAATVTQSATASPMLKSLMVSPCTQRQHDSKRQARGRLVGAETREKGLGLWAEPNPIRR